MEYGEETIRPIDNTIYLVVFCAMFYGGAYPHLGNVFVFGEKSMVLVCTFLCDIVACFMCKNIKKDWFTRIKEEIVVAIAAVLIFPTMLFFRYFGWPIIAKYFMFYSKYGLLCQEVY